MSSSRERILQRVRDALGARPAASPPPAAPRRELDGDLVARFRERLLAVAGEVVEQDAASVHDAIAQRLARAGAKTVALGGGDEMERLGAELRRLGFSTLPASAPTEELARADAGVTEAQWGVAETGTIALDDVAARARRVSLLPPLHVAVLRRKRMLDSLDDLFAASARAGIPHALTLVTGPSRTADIELQLVVGVHGPGHLCVVLC